KNVVEEHVCSKFVGQSTDHPANCKFNVSFTDVSVERRRIAGDDASSSSTTALETAGWEMLRRFAAFPMLPVSTTANRTSRSRSFRRRLVRSSHGMKSLIPKYYEVILQ